jgi:hypothetical protein
MKWQTHECFLAAPLAFLAKKEAERRATKECREALLKQASALKGAS